MKTCFSVWFTLILLILVINISAQNVGINTNTPAFPLTVKTTTHSGFFVANDKGMVQTDGTIQIGTGIFQAVTAGSNQYFGYCGSMTNNEFHIVSNGYTGIILNSNNVNGSVVIGDNTTMPNTYINNNLLVSNNITIGNSFNTGVPLYVSSGNNVSYANASYFNSSGGFIQISNGTTQSPVSIVAEHGIWGEYIASYSGTLTFSDARIKNIIGTSNALNDLALLRKIKITDYTMKDNAKYGNKQFKKVIAQQIEEIYPQAISVNTGVIPDIYVVTSDVKYNQNKKQLTFVLPKDYLIKEGERLQLIDPIEGKAIAEVINISGNSITVDKWPWNSDKIFVFGREVNDVRSVDYDALSTLNISATQKISELLEKQEAEIEMLKSEIILLKKNSCRTTSQ